MSEKKKKKLNMTGVFLMLHLCTVLDMGSTDLSVRYNDDELPLFSHKRKKQTSSEVKQLNV